ncbi:unnamed protein product [Cylindrotheca closterium]|uniref:EGF-like domain-containing protein n=1 Tax=Cylindrotheca closterium TaxID=2856 RepID=A0AAD2CA09_9STRA|nr:unnamed protein product [Cylindrotheca closterium]
MKVSSILSTCVLLLSQAAAEKCGNLNCARNDIPCVEGEADFSVFPTDINGQAFPFLRNTIQSGSHCVCPEGKTGLRCARSYETCEGNDHVCFHGGKCIPGLNATVEDSKLFCDCSNAFHNGLPYRGKFCEVELEECAADSDIYCANNGNCKDDFESKLRPCDCPYKMRGAHCEFDDGHVPECKLECDNGGVCARGVKSYENAMYDDFWAQHDGNFQYCACQRGFYGTRCEAQATDCGDGQCFHGGKCIQTLNGRNKTIFACDCAEATKDGLKYAGQFCQSPSTQTCEQGEDNGNGQLFCTNNGKCKSNPHEGCDCEGDYHGASCEHPGSAAIDDVPKCALQCKNGGSCRIGQKDTSLFSQFGADMEKYNQTNIDFQHCVCPDGYFGVQCEHQLDVCPGGEHVCLHGSKCVAINESDPDTLEHKCDCEDSFDSINQFAGKYCQFESTDMCTKNGKPGLSNAKNAFCVNGGKCKSTVDDDQQRHPGCDCPDKYTGDHCEFIVGREPAASQTLSSVGGEEKADMDLLAALAVILAALIVAIAAMLYMAKKKTKADKATDDTVEKAEEDQDVVVEELPSPEKKGYEAPDTSGQLRTVEII